MPQPQYHYLHGNKVNSEQPRTAAINRTEAAITATSETESSDAI